jgi:hypothetical protein
MNLRHFRSCAVAMSAALVLGACGGSSGSAASSSTSTTGGGSNGQNSAFTACLKQHGVTLPAGGFGGNGAGPGGGGPPRGATGSLPNGSPPIGGSGGRGPSISIPGVSRQDLQAAFSACRSKLPSGRFGGGANPQDLQAYTSCLGDHGVKVPTSGSGSQPGGRPGLGALRSDPKFAAANKTCRALLPTNAGSTTTTTAG